MKFRLFKTLTNVPIPSPTEIWQYLSGDLAQTLRDLQYGLERLTFSENFNSFQVSVTIPANSELAIRNKLRDGLIPSSRIILRSNSSNIVDGDTAWTKDYVYLKNTAATDATATVVFLK